MSRIQRHWPCDRHWHHVSSKDEFVGIGLAAFSLLWPDIGRVSRLFVCGLYHAELSEGSFQAQAILNERASERTSSWAPLNV